MSIYRREIDAQCCNQWMNGIRTINGQYPDDNRDFDINAGVGIKITPATAGITIENTMAAGLVAGDNIEISTDDDEIEIALVSDPVINGDLQVNGDIIQNGSAYETHAEQVLTTKDYIIMREGAISALSAGDYSGFQVRKYDGINDGRLVMDMDGIARVGDIGDEQPLMTRDEVMPDNALLKWDATNLKAVPAGTSGNLAHVLKGSISVLSSQWQASIRYTDYLYEANVTIAGVSTNGYPVVTCSLNNSDNSIFAPIAETNFADTLTLYATEAPTGTNTFTYMIIEE